MVVLRCPLSPLVVIGGGKVMIATAFVSDRPIRRILIVDHLAVYFTVHYVKVQVQAIMRGKRCL